MDIWHRVGRVVRFSNLGTVLFFALNIFLIAAIFGSSGNIMELICIYFITVAISLSPIGEMCLAAFAGAKDIKRTDIKLRVIPLIQYVLDKTKENTSYCPQKVKVMIIHDSAPNAFALGKRTLCLTDGLLSLPDNLILGILAHEIGHLSYRHTVIQLLIGGGNIFISGCLLLDFFCNNGTVRNRFPQWHYGNINSPVRRNINWAVMVMGKVLYAFSNVVYEAKRISG